MRGPPSVTFLISRQPRALGPDTWWLRAVEAAARRGIAQGLTLRCGTGLTPVDYAAWVYRTLGGEVVIIEGEGPARDREVAAGADVIIPISVRRGGTMEALLHDALAAGKEIIDAKSLNIVIPQKITVRVQNQETPDDFLWHCTRGSPGPWPGQSQDNYFQSLFENDPLSSHTGLDTLSRILAEKKIRACGRLIRNQYPVVCFSAAPPPKLLKLRSYKPSLARWDFEPYAIGIRRTSLEARGARPVRYLPPNEYKNLSKEERHLYQKHLPPNVDTTHEEEWRMLGDFDFSGVPENDVAIFSCGAS